MLRLDNHSVGAHHGFEEPARVAEQRVSRIKREIVPTSDDVTVAETITGLYQYIQSCNVDNALLLVCLREIEPKTHEPEGSLDSFRNGEQEETAV